VEEALHTLHLETGVAFIHRSRESMNKGVVLTGEIKTVKEVLERRLKGSRRSYEVIGSRVVIHQKEKEKANVVKEAPEKITISGVIKDKLGNPLPGVSIQVLGGTRGTLTDGEGTFILKVNATDSLRFSYVGYETQTLPVRNRVDLDVVMDALEGSLNQVLIVGYGKQKKISMVGAQSSVDVGKLKLPTAKLNSSLAGRLAGVVSVSRTGE